MAVKQTAGRDALGEFAPKFAELNDDVLFGEVWSREEELSLRDRSLVTVVSLIAMGLTDNSFRYHLESAKKNGITASEMAEIITHAAFYVGWPKAWQRSAWQRRSMRHEGTGTVLIPTAGNTRRVAKLVQQETGADLCEIETVTPYTGSYNAVVDQGQREVNMRF